MMKLIKFSALLVLLTGAVLLAKPKQADKTPRTPRVWVDVTNQSPNIFTNADACPKDHPVELWVLDEKHKSMEHLVRVCGQRDAEGKIIER